MLHSLTGRGGGVGLQEGGAPSGRGPEGQEPKATGFRKAVEQALGALGTRRRNSGEQSVDVGRGGSLHRSTVVLPSLSGADGVKTPWAVSVRRC